MDARRPTTPPSTTTTTVTSTMAVRRTASVSATISSAGCAGTSRIPAMATTRRSRYRPTTAPATTVPPMAAPTWRSRIRPGCSRSTTPTTVSARSIRSCLGTAPVPPCRGSGISTATAAPIFRCAPPMAVASGSSTTRAMDSASGTFPVRVDARAPWRPVPAIRSVGTAASSTRRPSETSTATRAPTSR